MCGRFTITKNLSDLAAIFDCETRERAPFRYNIAPTQPVPVIFQEFQKRHLRLMRWGFVPDWVKKPEDFSLIINARSETVLQKPSFKSAIRHRRCIIPATGFYEWHRAGNQRTPYFIKPKDGVGVGYAALYETYTHANGSEIDTVCFMTTAASSDIADIHHRMPVLITPERADIWLDCVTYGPGEVTDFYDNSRDDIYTIVPISDRINKVSNDDEDVQTRVEPSKQTTKPTSDQLSLF